MGFGFVSGFRPKTQVFFVGGIMCDCQKLKHKKFNFLLLIYIPKCIELNSESEWVSLGFFAVVGFNFYPNLNINEKKRSHLMGRRLHAPLRTIQKMATARSPPPSDQTTAAAAADGRDPSSQRPLPQQTHAAAAGERPEQPDRRARLRRTPPRLSGRPAAPSARRAARRDAWRPARQGAVVC